MSGPTRLDRISAAEYASKHGGAGTGPQQPKADVRSCDAVHLGETTMPILLWLLGVPIPIIILLLLFWH